MGGLIGDDANGFVRRRDTGAVAENYDSGLHVMINGSVGVSIVSSSIAVGE